MAILFLDDDIRRTRGYVEGLRALGGYDVDRVSTPREAVETFSSDVNRYNLIILDLWMPHENKSEYKEFRVNGFTDDNESAMLTGLKVYQQLSEIMDRQGVRLPVIILSRVQRVHDMCSVLGLTPSAILSKRADVIELLKSVRSILGKRT